MYIRTPRKYRGTQRRGLVSCRRIVFVFLALVLIVAGIGIYQLRHVIRPLIEQPLATLIAQAENAAATAGAPTATPTQDPANILTRADNFWVQGSTSEALDLYLQVIDSVPNDVSVHYRVTLGLIMQGQYDDALTYAERTVTANPYSSDAWAIRSWALYWNRRPGEAISSALHALELRPENARAMAFLAEAYHGAGQTQRAQTMVQRALEADPDSFEAYRARGLISWEALFDREAAIADFETAYSIAPNMAFLAIDIAILESAMGNFQSAIRRLEGVIERDPENTSALFWLGSTYFSRLGDPSQAAGYLQRCIDYNPQSVNCHYLLGRTQNSLENYNRAADLFAMAIELGSSNPFHFWWAGRSQINLGNCARAMTYLEPGYQLAQQSGNAQLVSDYEAILPECQSFIPGGVPIITPTPDPDF